MIPNGGPEELTIENDVIQLEGPFAVTIQAGSFEFISPTGVLPDVKVKIDGREAKNIERLEIVADARAGTIHVWMRIAPNLSMFE